MKKTVLFLCSMFVGFQVTVAQQNYAEWVHYVSGDHTNTNVNNIKATDDAIYVNGVYNTSGSFGSVALPVLPANNAFITKTDLDGNPIWTATMGGSDSDAFFDIQIDKNNDVLAVGWSSSMGDIVINEKEVIAGEGPDYTNRGIIAKFSGETGALIWVKHWYASEYMSANPIRMVLDEAGSLYIAGYYDGPFKIGDTEFTYDFEYGYNFFLTKINADGILLWKKQIEGKNNGTYGSIRALAINDFGLYLAFDYGMPYLLDEQELPYSGSGYFMCLSKFSTGTGDATGFITYGAEDVSQANAALAVDSENNVIVGGNFTPDSGFNIQGTALNGYGISDGFIAKFDYDLNLIWAKDLGGEYQDRVFNITTNDDNAIFVGGGFDNYSKFNFDGSEVISAHSPNSLSMYQLHLNQDGSFNEVFSVNGYDEYTILSNNSTLVLDNGDMYTGGRFINKMQLIENGDVEDASDHTRGFFMKWANKATLGVADVNNATDANIYPNPFSDVIHVNIKNNEDLKVSLYTVTGQQVFADANFTGNSIQTNTLQPGIYFLKLEGKAYNQTIKLIKN
ncbi:T9SS type A sorting domain-containing protein [Formosa sp. S-31]|uniref:T9SS type A sorting domain-containing protein n=1 Tax=Formosa sp. S-31 TaxID=2790949 RepID=UPI003EBFA9E9